MEHKLIQGGEQYLPFARSRIKALRAAGLQYASQQFEIDGVSVKVRIAGEHEYISITGGSQATFMDSGLVDLKVWNPVNGLAGQTGYLHDTVKTSAYHAGFAPTDPVSTWKANAATGVQGQLSGLLTFGKTAINAIKGKIPYPDLPARSFQPGTQKDANGDWQRLLDDPDIIPKKYAAYNCPSSTFTGKCRLYVQAMYGAATYNGSTAPKIGPEQLKSYPTSFSFSHAATAPMLRVPARAANEQAVLLTTDCGVYLDESDGTHWLFCPVANVLEIYPLKSSKRGESLRKYLTADNIAGLAQEDLHNLEAFILMDCRPAVSSKMTAIGSVSDAGEPITGQPAMGYGWHWNKSGTKANIVLVQQYLQTTIGLVDYMGNESFHYEMSVNRNKLAGTWSVSVAAIEKNKKWCTGRPNFVITYPDWGTGLLAKITPGASIIAVGDAPFYVFYKGDVLQECRVTIRSVPASAASTTYTPGFENGRTYGMDGGSATAWNAGEAHYAVVFSCGTVTTGDMDTPWGRTGSVSAETNKTQVGGFPLPNYQFLTAGNTHSVRSGDGWVTLHGPGQVSTRNATVSAIATSDSRSQLFSSKGVAVIPPGDAEAIFFNAKSTSVITGNQTARTKITSGAIPYYTQSLFLPSGSSTPAEYLGFYGPYNWNDAGTFPTYEPLSNINPDPITSESTSVNTLVCVVGSIGLGTFDTSTFTDVPADDLVERDFRTISAASGEAVIPPSLLSAPSGCDTTDVTAPAFVGWA